MKAQWQANDPNLAFMAVLLGIHNGGGGGAMPTATPTPSASAPSGEGAESDDGGDGASTGSANSNRPDADRAITFLEAISWWHNGSGQPLFINLNSINLAGVYIEDFEGVGDAVLFNLYLSSGSINDMLVYGQLYLTYMGDGKVRASLGFDIYDFDMQENSPIRNVATTEAIFIHGEGTPFIIYLTGTATISHWTSPQISDYYFLLGGPGGY